MDNRILRLLIYLFSGVLVLFCLLILVNYIGSRAGSPSELPGQRDTAKEPESASAKAMQALAKTEYGGAKAGSSMLPVYRQGVSTSEVYSAGAINVVKDSEFSGVAEKPKSLTEMLSDMAGGSKRGPAPVRLKDSDLDKSVRLLGGAEDEKSLKTGPMPELGRGAANEGVTMLSAPVDFKVFRSSETWWAFANSHKCRSDLKDAGSIKPAPSPISSPDFSREYVLILISVSELPNGIFRIMRLDRAGGAVVVSYKVDPMAMAAANEVPQHDFYTAVVIPRSASVKLSQVP